MSLFTGTAFYQQQAAAATLALQATIRPDPSASFIVYAVPGNYFSGSFSMTNYNTDISQVIRGSGNGYGNLPATGSGTGPSASATQVKWTQADGYYNSLTLSGAKVFGAVANTVTDFQIGSGDYTIEMWSNSASTGTRNYFWKNGGTTAGSMMNFGTLFSDGRIRLVISSGTNQLSTDSVAQTRVSNTWYHVAFVKSGSTYSIYFNGSRVINFTNATYSSLNNGDSTAPAQFGGRPDDASQTAYFFQDYRIYKGSANYSGATITLPQSMVYYA
jgi:hypothetical protein